MRLTIAEPATSQAAQAQLQAHIDKLDSHQRGALDHGEWQLDASGLSWVIDGQRLHLDFLSGRIGWRLARWQQERLVKAMRQASRHLEAARVFDTTAGLAHDAVLLSAAGFEVIACEQHPALHLLAADAVDRARAGGHAWAQNLQLCCADSRDLLASQPAEIVYLDPMFEARGKQAAHGAMQKLRELHGDPEDADGLLRAALSSGAQRVLVKRPAKADALAGLKPNHSLPGRSVRFDVYLP